MFQSHKENHQASYAIGLDASLTSFGVYMLPIKGTGNTYSFTVGTDNKTSDTWRTLDLATEVIEAIDALPLQSIATFEDYGPVGRTSGKITARAEMCGIIKYHLLCVRKVPIILVAPKPLKQYACGNGNAKKEQMLNAANALGVFPATNDEADAFHAARFGRDILAGNAPKFTFQRINPR